MTYDQWKCQDPNEPYCDEPECEHEGFEINYEGRAQCPDCGQEWWASAAEIFSQSERQAEYDWKCRQRSNREFWRKLTYPIRWPIFRLLERIWPRKSLSVLTDDEIPF